MPLPPSSRPMVDSRDGLRPPVTEEDEKLEWREREREGKGREKQGKVAPQLYTGWSKKTVPTVFFAITSVNVHQF